MIFSTCTFGLRNLFIVYLKHSSKNYVCLIFIFNFNEIINVDEKELIWRQIEKTYWEIILIRIVFAIINTASILYFAYLLYCIINTVTFDIKDQVELLKTMAPIFVLMLSYVLQGYIFPKERKINALEFLLKQEQNYTDEGNRTEATKLIYDK